MTAWKGPISGPSPMRPADGSLRGQRRCLAQCKGSWRGGAASAFPSCLLQRQQGLGWGRSAASCPEVGADPHTAAARWAQAEQGQGLGSLWVSGLVGTVEGADPGLRRPSRGCPGVDTGFVKYHFRDTQWAGPLEMLCVVF